VPIGFNSMVSVGSATGLAELAFISDSAQLQVSYTYAPIPEPRHLTLGLLAIGLAAKFILRRRSPIPS
jgi:hypothetical protein